jgi:hypothetical protein
MQDLDEALFERAIQWVAGQVGEAHVRAARKAFEERTGTIEDADADYESRMSQFFEHWLCARDTPPSWLERFAGAGSLAEQELRQLAGWQRSYRGLFEFVAFEPGGGLLRDLMRGGRYRFAPGQHDRELTPGDRFDGRLVACGQRLWLSPGRAYQPRAAHAALDGLLAQVALRARPLESVLDGLLRMRNRFLRFASIRPEHVYRLDDLADAPFAAPWAKPESRGTRNA